MSHLDHIVRVKQKLTDLGVTCPFKQRELINHAFIDALVSHHFTVNPTFSADEKQRACYRQQLDRWNNVSPVGYEQIFSGFISTLNLAYGALRSTGRYATPSVLLDIEGGCALETAQEYKDLVGYLFQEVKNAHE